MRRDYLRNLLVSALLLLGACGALLPFILMGYAIVDQHSELLTLKSRIEDLAARPRSSLEALEAAYRSLSRPAEAQAIANIGLTEEEASANFQALLKRSVPPSSSMTSLKISPAVPEETTSYMRGTMAITAPPEDVLTILRGLENGYAFLRIEQTRAITKASRAAGGSEGPKLDLSIVVHFQFVPLEDSRAP